MKDNMDWSIGDWAIVSSYIENGGIALCAREHQTSLSRSEQTVLIIGYWDGSTAPVPVKTAFKRPFILLDSDRAWLRVEDWGVEITAKYIQKYNIDPKYEGKYGYLLQENSTYHWFDVKKARTGPDGQTCGNIYCKEFVSYAESNLPDNKFICRSCRTNVVTRDLTLARLGFNLEDVRKP